MVLRWYSNLLYWLKRASSVNKRVTILAKMSHCTAGKKTLDMNSKNLRYELLLNTGRCVVNFSPDALTPRVTVIHSLLCLTPWPSELTVQYDLDDVVQCCKADSPMLIMHSSGTSISVLQISCKRFSTCMGLMLLCSPHLFLVDVEMRFKYFSSHPFDATNVWRETIYDGFNDSAQSCKNLSQKNRALFLSTSPVMFSVGALISTRICHWCTMPVRSCTWVDKETFLSPSQFDSNATCLITSLSFQIFETVGHATKNSNAACSCVAPGWLRKLRTANFVLTSKRLRFFALTDMCAGFGIQKQ